jgi:GT2 family glycosyltransferase
MSTPFFGQVKQRNYGLNFVKNDLILQLDDDVLLDESCLKNLVNTYVTFGEKCVVGPQFRYFDGVSAWPIRSFLYQIFATVFWGSKIGEKRFGTINEIGCGHGVDFSIYKGDYKEVEWLSGGCVLQHKSSKLKEMHFPFEGKAYCEDLMQSLIQLKNGLTHICVKKAVCRIQKDSPTHENYNLKADFMARRYVLDLMGKRKIRLYIWYALKKIHWYFK